MKKFAKKLLLAEDDQEDVEFFQLAMNETCIDYHLIVAEDGDVLLKKMHEIKPDLVVLDLNMPRVSGIECLDKIRSNNAFDEVPIIILSTRAFEQDVEYCLANGANKFFKKPCSVSELSEIVKSICDEYIN